ncbi:eCIS core domain-containing protein [Chryseobacterium oryctis]|uniref:DUF4157 domain-containing protein n=1 Tax=Chryseobacterium oryctis TaxID=2952618 RepID=A0ABT3HRM5_9FLAO|nr:DUF4157 domain-containing protein [Chryseobacterium oryctis]MCW3162441.1 DUF4157 domain-containing protein [Chryseobacterium oryctis]
MEKVVSTQEKVLSKKSNSSFFKPVIQKKLSIGTANDVFEAEADSVAEKVLNTSSETNQFNTQATPLVQKKCAQCEEEERLRRKPLAEDVSHFVQRSSLIDSSEISTSEHKISHTTPLVQKKCAQCEEEERMRRKEMNEVPQNVVQKYSHFNSPEALAPSYLENQIRSSQGSGQMMDNNTKGFMESRFGVDFSSVRIHTDSQASTMSKELNARAFTVGNDVYFNQGEYSPSTSSGKFLLAHELTHTIQQGGSNIKKLPIQSTKDQKIQRNILTRIGGGIADAASTAWDYTGGAVIRFGGRVIEWVEDRAEDIINSIAPGLLNFLRSSIWEPIRDMIARGLDTLTGGLFSRLQEEGLSGILHEFVDGIMQSLQGTIADACRSFAQIAEKISNFISRLGSGALARLRSVFNRVSSFFSSIWSEYGRPAMDAIRHFASDAWNWIVEKVNWLWDLIEPIRNAIERAWNWIKRIFNIAWESVNSVWDWIVEKATQAWNWIKEAIEPIRVPLMIIGGILVMLSPLGPFVLIGATVYGIYRAVQWVRTNWNNEVFVRFRNYIQQNILTPIQQGIEQLRNLVNSALQWINSVFQQLQAAFQSLVNAVIQSSIFTFLRSIVQSVANMIQEVSSWIATQCIRIGEFIADIAQRVWALIRPFVSIVAKLIILATYPWLIPIVLTAWYWRILPDCFKPPIINFVLRIMIGVLRAMPNFAMFGETWVQVKGRIIAFLQEMFAASDEEKTAAVNRVAVMVSEMDLTLLSNQVAAARGAPGEFEGQMEEELIGVDLTTPLPFERTSVDAATPALSDQLQESGIAESIHPDDAALFGRREFTEQHIGVDSIGDFTPSEQLQEAIMSRTGEDGTVEFGNSTDSSRTVHGILSEMIPAGGGIGGEEGTTESADSATGDGGVSHAAPLSHEEETESRLQQMMAQSSEEISRQPCTMPEASSEGRRETGASAFPEAAKFGPLTRSQRARYTLNQMYNGIGHWWQCNRSWLIPAILGVIIVLVLVEILTGGAITAALPAIFSALGPIMIGVAVIRSSYYLGEYVYKSIAGDIQGASKSLARAFAVAAVEAIFALLGSSAFWGRIRDGAKGAAKLAGAAISATGRVIARTGRVGARLVRGITEAGHYVLQTTRAMVSRGRLIMSGVRGRIGQGVRTLEELGERLFSRVRFRRFRIRFNRGWFRLEGYINPWVLLATGELQFIEQNRLRPAGGGGLLDDTVRLGDEVLIGSGSSRGIIVGVERTPSRFVDELGSLSRSARVDEFRGLRGSVGSRLSAADRLRIIQNGETTAALRRGISGVQPANFQAHHIVPRELRGAFDDFFTRIGFNIEDGARNGIMVAPDLSTRAAAITLNPSLASQFGNSALHLGSHPNYTARMASELTTIRTALDANLITEAQALSRLDAVIGRARTAISNGGGIHINNVVF